MHPSAMNNLPPNQMDNMPPNSMDNMPQNQMNNPMNNPMNNMNNMPPSQMNNPMNNMNNMPPNQMNNMNPNMFPQNNNMMGGFPMQVPNMNNMNFQGGMFNNMMNIPPQERITVEGEHLLEKVKEILATKTDDDRTESLGETLFYFLTYFIPQYKLNTTGGKFSDTELCSKLTGILIKTDENNLCELLAKTERLYNSLKDVIEKMLSSGKLG